MFLFYETITRCDLTKLDAHDKKDFGVFFSFAVSHRISVFRDQLNCNCFVVQCMSQRNVMKSGDHLHGEYVSHSMSPATAKLT